MMWARALTNGAGASPSPASAPKSAAASIGLGFCAGTAGYFLQAQPSPALAIAVLLALSVLGVLLRRLPPWLAALAAGYCWSHLWVCSILCQPFPETLARQTVIVTGRVAALPDVSAERTRFLFDIESLNHAGRPVDFAGRVRLAWYRDAPQLLAGERWRLAVRLKPPHGFVNPGAFDYERWLFRQQVKATGYVRADDGASRLQRGAGRYWLDRWRQQVRARLVQGLPDGVASALVPALVIGDRSALTPANWGVFSATGTSHLIAISGLHVGLIAGVVFFAVRRAWSWVPALALRVAAPRAAALMALGAALGYAALAGFAVSTQRALVMLAVVLGAVVARRTLRPSSALLTALVAVLLLDPASVLDYGFWLSFGAVAVLLYALAARVGPPGLVARWGAAQWAVALGLLPMLIAFFGRASLIAPAVNLIAVPLFGLLLPVILAAALIFLTTGWSAPLVPVGWLLTLGYEGLRVLAELPWASVTLGARPGWVWFSAAFGSLLLLAPRGVPSRWLGLVLLLPLWLARPMPPDPGALQVTLLDVGQGLAGVVRTHRHCLVYDVGPSFRSGFSTGEAVVARYLQEQGIRRVDLLMISHADEDHSGGLRGLLRVLPASRILSGEPDALEEPGAEACRRGQRWHWDGVDFEVLHPGVDAESGNNSSCVLRVSVGDTVLLWPGDIEAAVERQLLREDAERLESAVLIAAHHGSASSTTAPFLAQVSPDWVLFSMGWMNRYGFPADSVLERVAAGGAAGLDTASSGAIDLFIGSDGEMQSPRGYRQATQRLWRHRPPAAGVPVASD